MVITSEKTSFHRTESLMDKSLSRNYSICIERARLITESYMETESQPPVIRQALALEKILSEMPIFIQEGELIVGNRTSKPLGACIFPEIFVTWLHHDIDTFDKRKTQSWKITEEEKAVLRDFVMPYWKNRDLWSRAHKIIPKETKMLSRYLLGVSENELFYGIGHLIHGLIAGINEGLLERKRKAQEYMNNLDLTNPEDLKKSVFYKGVMIACDAVVTFANRHAKLAQELADKETDAIRKQELLKIVEICEHIPAHPARNFYEAIQSAWMIYLGGCIEIFSHCP